MTYRGNTLHSITHHTVIILGRYRSLFKTFQQSWWVLILKYCDVVIIAGWSGVRPIIHGRHSAVCCPRHRSTPRSHASHSFTEWRSSASLGRIRWPISVLRWNQPSLSLHILIDWFGCSELSYIDYTEKTVVHIFMA